MLNWIFKIIIVIAVWTQSTITFSQPLSKTMALSGNVGIPKITNNAVLKENFTGVFDAKIAYDFYIYKGFLVGLVGDLSEFQYKYYKWGTNGLQVYNYSAGLRFGYAQPLSEEKGYWISRAEFGNSYIKYANVNPGTSTLPQPTYNVRKKANFIVIDSGLYFFIDDEKQYTMGGGLGYVVQTKSFDPNDVNLKNASANSPTINKETLKGNVQYLTLNLGFQFYLRKSASKE